MTDYGSTVNQRSDGLRYHAESMRLLPFQKWSLISFIPENSIIEKSYRCEREVSQLVGWTPEAARSVKRA